MLKKIAFAAVLAAACGSVEEDILMLGCEAQCQAEVDDWVAGCVEQWVCDDKRPRLNRDNCHDARAACMIGAYSYEEPCLDGCYESTAESAYRLAVWTVIADCLEGLELESDVSICYSLH